VLTVTTVGVLMSGIDTRILVIGLPHIATALHADAEQAVWFTQGYALASTVSLLLIGRVTDIFGRVKLYKIGFVVFTVGSLLTSLSLLPSEVIAFRLIQGLGASMLWSNSIAIITDATPRKELGFSLGVNQIALNLGSVLGLTLSGLILYFGDWRALFYINIPIGIFGTVWAHLRLREIATLEKGAPIDWIGFGTFVVSLTSLLLTLTYAAYGIAELLIIEMLIMISIVCMFAFVVHERRAPYPLLDLRLLRVKEFSGASVALLINIMATSSLILLLSLYFQLVVGLSPLEAGIHILPIDVAMITAAPLSGRLSDRFGKVPFLVGGLVLASVATALFSSIDAATPYYYLATYMIIFGASAGVFLSPNSSWSMMNVPPNRRGVASSVRATFWNIGFTVSLNLAVWIMTFTVPYEVVTQMLSSVDVNVVSSLSRGLFLNGLKNAYLWLAMLNAVALVPILVSRAEKEVFLKKCIKLRN
jgi:EmrB/QacA subfamily drug resistance transporter